MPTYNLPAIRLDRQLPQPGISGQWDQVPNLDALADSLAVGSEKSDPAQLKSIPDAWAQAQVFQQALLDRGHPLHEEVVAQWRGLLALLALQPEFETVYDVEIATVELRESRPGKRLQAVLSQLLPSASVAPSVLGWGRVGCVLFRDRGGRAGAFARVSPLTPLGLLSPSTLIAAGRDAHLVRCADVPWMKDGLSDPVRAGGLAPRHYEILARYLGQLADGLVEALGGQANVPVLDRLIEHLKDYHDACAERGNDTLPLADATLFAQWPDPTFAVLGRTKVLDHGAIEPDASDCRIALRDDAPAAFKGLILVDPTLTETFGRAPEAITVWGRYTLKDAGTPATLARIRQDAEQSGYVVVEPRDFFTNELVTFTSGTEIEAHGRQGFEAALMPFSPLVLLIFRPESLALAAQLNTAGDEHRVRLEVALPSGKRHPIRKSFGPDQGPEAALQAGEDRPEDLALWPNFAARNWRWNYLHFQCSPNYEVMPRFALSAEFLTSDIAQGALSPTDKVRRLGEWTDPVLLAPDRRLFTGQSSEFRGSRGELLIQRLRFADTDKIVGEVQLLPRGVEAIFFARRQDGEGTERPVGLVLVRPKTAPLAQSSATVAIDFGTTNTVAYEVQGSSRSPIVFEDRLLFPIRQTAKELDQRERLASAYTQFFPLKRHETPFPTVAKKREFQSGSGVDENLWRQIQQGHEAHGFSDVIFFVPQFDKINLTEAFLDWTAKGILVFGIKWARGEQARRLTRRFLRQVMMMCAAELVDRGVDPQSIQWRFSYPQAFTRQDRTDLESQIIHAWKELFELGEPEARRRISLETEGAAAAHYFMYGRELDQVPAGDLMLMFDIGGGTTDVALWYNEELRWRNSFRLAGGDFFTRYLANNIDVLKKIQFGDVASSLNHKGGGGLDDDARLNFVELFVNAPNFSRNFDNNFPNFSMEKEGAGLRYCASVAVGGIFYYIGLVLRQLSSEGVIEQGALKNIALAFAGRGSALLRYFDRGSAHDTPLHHLGGLIPIAAGLDPTTVRIDTLFSKMPKHEVALGLLANRSSVGSARKESRSSPVGERLDVAMDGRRMQFAPGDDVRRLLTASDPRELPLAELTVFLKALKAQTGIEVDLAGTQAAAARQIQQNAVQELRRALRETTPDDLADDTQFIEPPFVTELRGLVNVMNLSVDQRDRMVTVKERVR